MAISKLARCAMGLAFGLGLLSTGACAWLVSTVAEEIADDEQVAGTTGRAAAPPRDDLASAGGDRSRSAPAAQGSAVSTYEVSPSLTWGSLGYLRPHSITGSLFEGASLGRPACDPIPRGLWQVTGAPSGSPAQNIYRIGPVRIGVAGLVVPLETVFTTDRDTMARRAFQSGALLAQRGPVCSHYLFFYVSLGGNEARETVTILR